MLPENLQPALASIIENLSTPEESNTRIQQHTICENAMLILFPVDMLMSVFVLSFCVSSTTCPSGGSPVIRTSWLFITRWTWSICSTVASSSLHLHSARTDSRTLARLTGENKHTSATRPATRLKPKPQLSVEQSKRRIANFYDAAAGGYCELTRLLS